MIIHKLRQIIERIQYIEAFSFQLKNKKEIMRKMAFRAIEREIEVIAILWDSIIADDNEIDLINIENIMALDKRINSTYVEAQMTLIGSILKGTIPKLKNEIQEVLESQKSKDFK